MKKFKESIIFSFFVTISMVMLDGLYHLKTDTAFHLNYASVKFTLIFLVLFLTVYFVGKSLDKGIFVAITGPVIFYIYYLFADPTLNRAKFAIDDSFGYIFLHIAVFALSYFIFYNFISKKSEPSIKEKIARAFMLAISFLGIDVFFQLARVQLTTHNEEITATILNFTQSFYILLSLFVIYFLVFKYVKGYNYKLILIILFSTASVNLFGFEITMTIIAVLSSGILFYLLNYYKTLEVENEVNKFKGRYKFLIAFIITGIVGAIYTFSSYKFLTKTLGIGLGLRHNDHVMIGTIALTIMTVMIFRFFSTKN